MIVRTILSLIILSLIALILLTGCETAPKPPSGLEKPAAWLMTPPKRLPEINVGDDIGNDNLKIAKQCTYDNGRLRRLQNYVRVITK